MNNAKSLFVARYNELHADMVSFIEEYFSSRVYNADYSACVNLPRMEEYAVDENWEQAFTPYIPEDCDTVQEDIEYIDSSVVITESGRRIMIKELSMDALFTIVNRLSDYESWLESHAK